MQIQILDNQHNAITTILDAQDTISLALSNGVLAVSACHTTRGPSGAPLRSVAARMPVCACCCPMNVRLDPRPLLLFSPVCSTCS